LWTAPVVGVAVGLLGAAVYGLAQALHLPPLPAAVPGSSPCMRSTARRSTPRCAGEATGRSNCWE
jgi:hypothetical protein